MKLLKRSVDVLAAFNLALIMFNDAYDIELHAHTLHFNYFIKPYAISNCCALDINTIKF